MPGLSRIDTTAVWWEFCQNSQPQRLPRQSINVPSNDASLTHLDMLRFMFKSLNAFSPLYTRG